MICSGKKCSVITDYWDILGHKAKPLFRFLKFIARTFAKLNQMIIHSE